MTGLRRTLTWPIAALITAALLVAPSYATAADASFVIVTPSSAEYSLACHGTSQLCGNKVDGAFQATGAQVMVQAYYLNGCAAIRQHIYLDGTEVAVTPYIASGSSAPVSLGRPASGLHVLALEVEGRLGGCDSGVITGTSGGLRILSGGTFSSSLPPPPPPRLPKHAVLESLEITARVLQRFTEPVAVFTHALPRSGKLAASDFVATIAWGDGTTSSGTVRGATLGGRAIGRDVFVVDGTHVYRKAKVHSALIRVAKRGDPTESVTTRVRVERLDPTPFFFFNPGNPTNGDVALLVPQPATPLQRQISEYRWTFSDGNSVVDSADTRPRYMRLLHELMADPGNGSLKDRGVGFGILPPGASGGAFGVGGLSADQVRQVVGVWLSYFPRHMVPHIYPRSGAASVSLRVTDTADKAGFIRQHVSVADHCLEWGGPAAAVFGHTTTCDTVNGFKAIANGPQRRPDYYAFDLAGGGRFASAGVTVTVTHDRNVFLGLHGALGPSASIAPGQLAMSEGFVGPPNGEPPPDASVDSFVVGLTIPVNATLGPFGLTLVLSPGCNCPGAQGGAEYVENGNASSVGLTIGASCSINLGQLPGVSDLAPPDNGPWPHNHGQIPKISAAGQQSLYALAEQDAMALQGCGIP